MTSPDKSVPAGSYVGTPGASNSLNNLQKVTWAAAQASVLSTALGAFTGFGLAGDNLTASSQQALTTATSAQNGAATAQSTASSTQTAAAANAAVIAGLTAHQSGQQTGGTSFADSFGRNALGAGYNVFKTGPVADLVVANGQVQLNQTGDQNTGNVVALSTTTLQTDNQSVSVVLGAANQSGNAAMALYIRSAVDLSTFVYAGVSAGNVSMGYGTRANGSTSYNNWTSGTASAHTGDTVTLQVTGSNYELLINGVPVLGYTDSAAVSPVGAANRSFGFDSEYVWTGLFGYFSFATAGLSATDLSTPAVTGVGWSLARISSAGVPQNTGDAPCAAGTFDNVLQSSGVTLSSASAGQVQVPRSGWYLIDVGCYLSNQDTQIRAELWTAPSPGGVWSMLRAGPISNLISAEFDGSGNETDVGQVTSAAATFVVYLTGGSVVAPGLKLNVANTLVGPNTHFDGALLNF